MSKKYTDKELDDLFGKAKQAKRAYEAAPKMHKREAKDKMDTKTDIFEEASMSEHERKKGRNQLSKMKDRRDKYQKVKDLLKGKK